MDEERLTLDGYRLAVDETFTGPQLDRDRWFPYYNPHWADLASTAARFEVGGGLRLRIDDDTPAWSREYDGEVRVSHLQTGQFSGPVGSGVGQHRFRDGLVVRSQHPELALWHVGHGVLEVRARAIAHPDAMVACWPIGVERDPRDSGELCLFEIFGSEMDATGGLVGVGVKPHHDDRLIEDFEKVRIEGDLTGLHDYSMEWLPDRIRFFVDGSLVKTCHQAIDYPIQLMLDVYDLPRDDGPRDLAALPHVFEVARVRSWV
jgi:hypothetical protein